MVEMAPTGININGTNVGFDQIHRGFSGTDYGKRLSGRTRYDRYKPEGLSNEEWVSLLGADVNNLEHMRLTYGMTRQFIKYNEEPLATWAGSVPEEARLTQHEKEDLLLAATIHDWGEAVVGDKMFDLKQATDDTREMEVLHEMTQGLYGEEENAEFLGRIETILRDVLQNKQSKLGKAFNAVERVGYLRTGLLAWDRSKSLGGDQQELVTGLNWLTNNVLLNQIPTLLDYAKLYPAVDTFLKENNERISSAFNSLPEAVFNKYDANEAESKRTAFETAKRRWNEAMATQAVEV